MRLVVVYGVYGAERDALIARSKIVLNVHFYGAKVLEVVRLSHLLSNGAFVISEDGGEHASTDATEVALKGAGALVFARVSEIAARVAHYLAHPAERRRIACRGRAAFARMRLAPHLLRAVVGLPGAPPACAHLADQTADTNAAT